jgi:hypothetical protein
MLSRHPANLILRSFLEFVGLLVIGQWGWRLYEGGLRFVFGLGLPVLLAVLWATLTVPADPSLSGKVLVQVPGRLRLAFELLFFLFALWTLFSSGQTAFGLAFGIGILLHYFWSMDWIVWLLRN